MDGCITSLTTTADLPGVPDPASPDPASPDPASPDPASPDPASPDPGWPDPGSLPLSRPGVSTVVLDGSLALYDEFGHVLVMLNSSATAVWERCEGHTTFEEIVEDLARINSVSTAVVLADAHSTLHELARLGLVGDARMVC